MATEAATQEERAAAKRRIVDLVLDEIKELVVAINVEKALGQNVPGLVLKIERYGGPELIIDEPALPGLVMAKLLDLLGQNLDFELRDGRIVVFSPSWAPDRIPF